MRREEEGVRRAARPVVRSDYAGPPPPAPPEDFGPMPQKALNRGIITEEMTGASDRDLLDAERREELRRRILKTINKTTDVHAEEIVLTDLAVQ